MSNKSDLTTAAGVEDWARGLARWECADGRREVVLHESDDKTCYVQDADGKMPKYVNTPMQAKWCPDCGSFQCHSFWEQPARLKVEDER